MIIFAHFFFETRRSENSMSESEDYEYAYSSDEDGIDDGGTMEWDDNAPENPNAAPSMSSSSTYPKRKYTKALWVASRT